MDAPPSPYALRALARSKGVEVTLHPADRPMPTVEDAARALDIRPDEMTKNLLFIVDDKPVLAIARGPALVDKRVLARHYGVGRKRVKLASRQQTLEITGFEAGCVPPFGHRIPLPTIIDESVMRLDRVYGGTSEPTILLSLSPTALLQMTEGHVLQLSGDLE